MSAREVLRDARLERGETPAPTEAEELVEAMRLTHDPDPLVRALAEQATDEVSSATLIRAWWGTHTKR